MSYGTLTDFWSNFGDDMGSDAGRDSDASSIMVDVTAGEPSGGQIQGETPSAVTEMDEKLRSLVNRFVSRIEEKNWKDSGYYISDVYACESPERAKAVARRLAERAESFGRGLIAISIHNDHVHSIHSCPYTSRTCRCQFKNFPEAKEDIRRLLRQPRAIETFQRRDWENITKYFCTNGRRTTYFKIFGTVQRIPLEITALSNNAISSKDGGGSNTGVENCKDPFELHDGPEGSVIPARPGPIRRRKRGNPVYAGGERGIGGLTGIILSILNTHAVCPLSDIVNTTAYLTNSEVCTKRLDSREVKDAIDTRGSIINTWEREDFLKFYNDPNTIKIWSARNVHDVPLYYMSHEDTLDVIHKLLVHQVGIDGVSSFCIDLINILERRVPKLNCLCVISPPSAGKNFFFDAIRDYYLNAGQMNNPNKYNQFAYQDCTNRRIIIWNEPNYELRETENLKMLFAGDNLSANVKCKPQSNVKRTPIIVTTNSEPYFTRQHAFEDRVKTYRWVSAPFLRNYDKKPLPTSVMDYIYSQINE